jgi:peptidyl-prolyl cis-trans isomerase SurA
MNKSLLSLSWALWAALGLGAWVTGASAQAQTQAASIRPADFIVAVVNSEPITNQEVQLLSQRLSREAAAQGRKLDTAETKRLALEQLINEKAQLQQARDMGIRIDDEALDQAEQNVANSNQISRDELRRRVQQEGTSLPVYREQLRQQLTLARVREREVEGRVRISDLEVEQFLQERLKEQAALSAQAPAELNLGMILIAVPENLTEAQVQPLSERARQLAQRARSGEDFAALAKANSQAPDLAANGGVLGLRSASRYPELFVNATRALAVGAVSEPVRSGAGFHILKVLERRQPPATLMVTQTRARHILLRPGAQLSQEQALNQLNGIRKDILSGKADFAAVAKSLSQDGSAQQGGDLGWANPGMFVPEFEQVMNRLRPGQIAEPLVSRFGVHLIEVTERRNAPMSDAQQREIARNALREKKLDEAYASWSEDLRSRAYVEMREPPQ